MIFLVGACVAFLIAGGLVAAAVLGGRQVDRETHDMLGRMTQD